MKKKSKYYFGGIVWLQTTSGIPASDCERTAPVKDTQFFNIIISAIQTAYNLQTGMPDICQIINVKYEMINVKRKIK